MELTCSHEKLRSAVQLAEKTIAKNNALPILKNILLDAQKSHLIVRSTNLEIGFSQSIPAKVVEEGKITIPADIMSSFFAHNSNQENIILKTNEETLHLETPNNKTKIIVGDGDDFPQAPTKTNAKSITLNHESVHNALTKTIFATSPSDTRPELAGIYIVFDEKAIRFVATDSFRLVECKIIFEESPQNYDYYKNTVQSCILPKNTASELLRIIAITQKPLTLTIENNQVFCESGDCMLVSQIIDGTYPDYEQIMPQGQKTTLIIDKKILSEAIKASSVFVSAQNTEIAIEIIDGAGTIQSRATERGAHTTVLQGVIDGDDQSIALNPRYILDGVNACEGDVVVVINGPQAPVLITPQEDALTHTYRYIVMPVKKT